MSFFEFWRSTRQRGALLRRANQRRLNPSQLSRLLGDSEVRAALQNEGLVSLLPPVGTEVFRRFTPASLEELQQHEAEEKERQKTKNKEAEEKHLPKPATHLEAGELLPFFYGDPPPELLNTPLEELDPFYQSQKTFLVLSSGNIIHRFNAESACYLLSPFHRLRSIAIKLLLHPLFSLFVMLTLLTNCVFMTLRIPTVSTTMECVFTAVYTMEALVKVSSRGFCVGRFTFIRDPWNWLDILIISTAFPAMLVSWGKFSVLVTIPRVLKIFAVSAGLKKTVEALVQSVKRLTNVAVIIVFHLSVFAAISTEFFMGMLKQKCVLLPSGWTSDDNVTTDHYGNETGSTYFDYSGYITNPVNYYYLPGQIDPLLCGNSSYSGVCPEGSLCLRAGKNPNYGHTSYDSFGWSLLAMFRIMTQDFCENLLQLTIRAAGKSSLLLFVLVFLPGGFFLLSLIPAVVAMVLVDQEEASTAKAKQREEEFVRIMEALKRREEEEQTSSRAAPPEEQDSPQKKKSAAGKQTHEKECVVMEGAEEDPRPSSCSLFLHGNCCGCWRRLKQRLHPFVTSPFFDLGIVVCLIMNTVVMAMEHYPMTAKVEELLSVAHLVFTVIFMVEMVLRLVVLGLYGYFQVSWHIFDFIIVFVSLVEMSLADVQGLSVLRVTQLLRVLRLARWWPSLHLFLKLVWTSVRSLSVVLLVVVFLFVVVGLQLFQRDYTENVCRISGDCKLPRWHMADFFHTFMVIFRVLCGEWIETMWDCMEVSGRGTCLVFFLMVVVVGNLLVLYLFLTLLLSSFTNDELAALEENQQTSITPTWTWILDRIRTLMGKKAHVDLDDVAVHTKKDDRKEYLGLTPVTSDQPELDGNHDNRTSEDRDVASCQVPVAEVEFKMANKDEEKKQKCDVAQTLNEKGNTPEDCCCDSCYSFCPFLDIDTSQGTGRVWSNFRRTCLLIVQHKVFEAFIVFIILLSSAALVLEDVHLQQRTVLQVVLDRADQVFTALFLLEMVLKWIAFGFKKYFTSFWCWLDFLILDVSLVALILETMGFSCRQLRALRTLRTLSRFEGMRVVLRALRVALPSMMNLLIVLLLIWLLFAILGTNLFAGKFSYCFNETSEELFLSDDVDNATQCFLLGENAAEVRWKHLKFNFDNVMESYLSLLIVATFAGWMDVMYAAVDSRVVMQQPVYENNVFMYLYFVSFVIIGCFFSLNFFIRGFITVLHQQRHQFGGKHVFMTEQQQLYPRGWKVRFSKKPETTFPRPQNRCRAGLFDLVTSQPFESFMMVVICLNVVPLMLTAEDSSLEMEVIVGYSLFAFILIFLIEFILKLIALGRYYFHSSLNILDFLVLIVSIADVFIADLMVKYVISGSIFILFRLVRFGRVLRFFRFTKGIRMLLMGFMMSLPALFNIGLLLFLTMYTFAVVGMFNFAYTKKGAMIDDMLNFETFWSSMISLITISASCGWDGLLLPVMNTPPDCDPYQENPGSTVRGDCGSPIVGIVFFTSYILLFLLLVIHLFIAVILETFNARAPEDPEDPEDPEALTDDHLQMFYKTWRKFDPDTLRVIPYSELSDFCDALQDPLRIPKPNSIRLIHMDLPLLPGDQICCLDVLQALSAQVFGESEQVDALKARLEEKFTVNNPSKVSSEPISSTLQRKQEEVAAAVIQRAYRKHLLQGEGAEAVGGASQ